MHCKNYDKPFETVSTKTTTLTYEDHFDVED